jgi:hypothetical protein
VEKPVISELAPLAFSVRKLCVSTSVTGVVKIVSAVGMEEMPLFMTNKLLVGGGHAAPNVDPAHRLVVTSAKPGNTGVREDRSSSAPPTTGSQVKLIWYSTDCVPVAEKPVEENSSV